MTSSSSRQCNQPLQNESETGGGGEEEGDGEIKEICISFDLTVSFLIVADLGCNLRGPLVKL